MSRKWLVRCQEDYISLLNLLLRDDGANPNFPYEGVFANYTEEFAETLCVYEDGTEFEYSDEVKRIASEEDRFEHHVYFDEIMGGGSADEPHTHFRKAPPYQPSSYPALVVFGQGDWYDRHSEAMPGFEFVYPTDFCLPAKAGPLPVPTKAPVKQPKRSEAEEISELTSLVTSAG